MCVCVYLFVYLLIVEVPLGRNPQSTIIIIIIIIIIFNMNLKSKLKCQLFEIIIPKFFEPMNVIESKALHWIPLIDNNHLMEWSRLIGFCHNLFPFWVFFSNLLSLIFMGIYCWNDEMRVIEEHVPSYNKPPTANQTCIFISCRWT